MRWLLSAWLFVAALGCEDDPDDLAHLRDAGTDAAVEPDAAADAATDEDASGTN